MRRSGLGFLIAVLGLLTLAPASLEAGDPATALQFSKLPTRAIAGQAVTVRIARAPAGAQCSLDVKYAKDPTKPALTPKTAVDGLAAWTWTIPDTVQANFATLRAACEGSRAISSKLLIVGGLIPPKMTVLKDGYSIRPASYGSGTDVSYGILIKNASPNADAMNVNVLVNFVLADDHLLGSASASVPLIPAGSTYALGNDMGFPGAAPITRLEIVIQVGGTARHSGHPPALDNVVIEPSLTDQGWVGDVAGEVINNDPKQTLSSVQFSAVILDGAGNVLGGGNGSTYSKLPPGTREVFKLASGAFRDIPADKAATVIVSAVPTWQSPSGGT